VTLHFINDIGENDFYIDFVREVKNEEGQTKIMAGTPYTATYTSENHFR
jgi:hypothetical protein